MLPIGIMWMLERAGGSSEEELYCYGQAGETKRSLDRLMEEGLAAYDAESKKYRPAAEYSEMSLLDAFRLDGRFEPGGAFIESVLDSIELAGMFDKLDEFDAPAEEDEAWMKQMLAETWEKIRERERAKELERVLI